MDSSLGRKGLKQNTVAIAVRNKMLRYDVMLSRLE